MVINLKRVNAFPLANSQSASSQAITSECYTDSLYTAQLLERTLEGDADAAEELFLMHHEQILNLSSIWLGNRDDAKDLTQRTFEKALRNLRAAQGKCFGAWLFCIARRLAIDEYRIRGRRPSFIPFDIALDLISTLPSTEDEALQHAKCQAVREEVAKLRGNQRLIIEMDLAGYSYREISNALGKSYDAIKQAHYHAKRTLKTRLIDWR